MRDSADFILLILKLIVLIIYIYVGYNTYYNIKDIEYNTFKSAYYLEKIYNNTK